MAKDICEHILLVLTAIIGDKGFEHLFSTIRPLSSGTSGDYQWIPNVNLIIYPAICITE